MAWNETIYPLCLKSIDMFRCVPSPLPRQDGRVRSSLASPATATFPVIMAGRFLH